MLSKSLCQQAASFALALTLSIPSYGFAADAPATKLIFPGDPLPKELGFSPLKVGTGGDAEVQVAARDWFLLKDKGLVLLKPVLGKTLDINGPILEPSNTQTYFRLMSGLVLKETLVQMGMNAGQAKRFIEKSQQGEADFDSIPLAKLGELPKGLSYLYENWDRTPVKMAIIPNILLPLAVAYDQSQLQHFAKAGLNDQEAQKTCSTISTVSPIAPVQSKIDEATKQMESINTDLRNAQARLVQSAAEQVRLNGLVKDISSQIDGTMQCFDVIKTRVSRGGPVPDAGCLNIAAAAMTEAKLAAEWTKFASINLKNDQGDQTVKKQRETEVRALEARVNETQAVVRSLQEQQDKAKQDKATAEDKLKRLNDLYGPEKSKSGDLDKEQEALKAELLQLQTLDFKLKSGNLKSEFSEDQLKAAIAGTSDREKRMAAIDVRSKQIVPEQVKRQAYQASILTQIQGVTATLDEKKAQIATLDIQLNEKVNGYNTKLTALQAELALETPKFMKISDEASFSEYVVSILMKKLAVMGQARDVQYNAVKEEEGRSEKYKSEITTADKEKNDRFGALAAQVTGLEALIASYRDVAQMGWFLETDCAARANFSGQQPGIYLSRAKISSVSAIPTTPVDGGKWGLFNLDFQHFQAPIQSGILLNVPGYVQMAVQQILENYDFAVTQTLDPAVAKCADVDVKGSSASVLTLMKTASTIWSEGADTAAKTRAFQCRTGVAAAPAVVAPVAAVAGAPAAPAVAPTYKYVWRTRMAPDGTLTQVRVAVKVKPPVTAAPAAATQIAGQPSVRGTSNYATFVTSLTKLANFEGSVLDAALPVAGQAHPVDLIERQAISVIGRELNILAGSVRVSGDVNESHERREQVIKALIRVLAYDYEGEIAKQTELSKAARTQYVFATNPPVKVASPTGMTAGGSYYVKTLGAVKLYTQPIAKAAYETNINLSMNDAIKVLQIDQGPGLVRGGWVKIQGQTQDLWMPAWPLSAVLLDESGREVQGLGELQNCPKPRVVLSLTNGRDTSKTVPRFSENASTREIVKNSGIFTIDENKTATVTPASTTKTYIACQNLAVEGQAAMKDIPESFKDLGGVDFTKVQAIRIIEVKTLRAANGKVVYVPQEPTGGYVQSWTRGRSAMVRISLGAEIDPATWSLRQ